MEAMVQCILGLTEVKKMYTFQIFYLFQMSEDEGDSSPVDEDESDEVILTIISNSHF